MGRQVNFYQHPEDLRAFEAMLRSRGDVRILRHAWNSPEPEDESDLLASLPTNSRSLDERIVLLARPKDVKALAVVHREPLGYWTADVRHSPVIEFVRSVVTSDSVTPGRLYLVAEGKPPDFIRLCDSLFRWIKVRYRRPDGKGFQFYRGPVLLEAAGRSPLQFKPI